jgi:CO/xanthine dehydrogenase FAD-binding subunit
MSSFKFYSPQKLSQLFELLKEIENNNETFVYLAGGTDLLIDLRSGKAEPDNVIDIKKIKELKGISLEGDTLRLGALTSITEIMNSPFSEKEFSIFMDAGRVFGCHEIRNRATLGGNIAHASPGAEFSSVFSVLDAEIETAGPNGVKSIPISEFILGVGKTGLENNEIITAIKVKMPGPKGTWKAKYKRLSRTKGMDLAGINVSVLAINYDTPVKRQIRISLGAVATTPFRPVEIEKMVSNTDITLELTEKLRTNIADSISPRKSSLRAGPEYKKAMAGQLIVECLSEIFDRPLMA